MMTPRAAGFVLLNVSIMLYSNCNEVMAWQISSSRSISSPETLPSPRRQFLFEITKTAASVTAAAATSIVMLPQASNAAAAAAPGMTADSARNQLRQAKTTIDDLLQNWSTVEGGGGDAIPDALRTKLGTQGITSSLFQIDKAFKALRQSEYVDDFVEFQETSEEFIGALYRADSMASSANNKTGSGKQTPPAVFIESARVEVAEMQRIANKMNSMVN
jgi:hypothetical protein